MAGRRDIDRTYKCVSEWRFFLVKSCICSFILSCFWQPYECVTGLSKVFWVVVSRYVCYSVCFSMFGKNSKVKFLIFFSWVVSFVLGSLWVVLRSSSVVWRSLWIVMGRCGSLWVVVDRCGSFRVLVTTLHLHALCNLVGRTYLMVTLITITAFSLCNLVGRTSLMVTLIIITAFALCNLVGRIPEGYVNNNHCICSP